MLKYSTIKFTALFICFIPATVFSQYNPYTNDFSSVNDAAMTMPVQQNSFPDFSQAGGFPCTPNTFWATSAGVDQYTLTGNTATFVSTVCAPYLFSLAYCDNLNGGTFSPTFYDCSDSTAAYYTGSGWLQIPLLGPGRLFNCGGNGNFLYYCVAPATSYPNAIARFDGITFTTIYTLPDTTDLISVADLNIDDAGNVWFFTGPIATFSTDTLNVISPSGQVLKQYPFVFNSLNAYGSFMLNGNIYLGLGSANPVHPNTLLPLIIGLNTVSTGTPVPMPSSINYGDLASCNAGTPLAVKEYAVQESFSLFPNPANDVLTITPGGEVKSEYKIVDVKGCVVKTISMAAGTVKADIHFLEAGVYFIESVNSKGISRKKFVKL